jgi:hypothetical protein
MYRRSKRGKLLVVKQRRHGDHNDSEIETQTPRLNPLSTCKHCKQISSTNLHILAEYLSIVVLLKPAIGSKLQTVVHRQFTYSQNTYYIQCLPRPCSIHSSIHQQPKSITPQVQKASASPRLRRAVALTTTSRAGSRGAGGRPLRCWRTGKGRVSCR